MAQGWMSGSPGSSHWSKGRSFRYWSMQSWNKPVCTCGSWNGRVFVTLLASFLEVVPHKLELQMGVTSSIAFRKQKQHKKLPASASNHVRSENHIQTSDFYTSWGPPKSFPKLYPNLCSWLAAEFWQCCLARSALRSDMAWTASARDTSHRCTNAPSKNSWMACPSRCKRKRCCADLAAMAPQRLKAENSFTSEDYPSHLG